MHLRVVSFALVLSAAACAPASSDPAPAVPPWTPPLPPPPSAAPAPPPASVAPLGPEASAITFDKLAQYPEPGMNVPRKIAFSADGKKVTFLQSEHGDTVFALYELDLATRATRVLLRGADLAKEEKVSREEELRRERQRQRAEGISDYRVAKGSDAILVQRGGDVFVRRGDGTVQRLTETPEPEIDPQICATGARVAYARGRELFAMDVAKKQESALTHVAPQGIVRGQSDFNAQEELDEPSGFFWSPACDKIAYLEVDERNVGEVPVLGYRGGKADFMLQRYPLTGGKNPVVRAGIVDVASKKTVWLKWPKDEERYLARFVWSPDDKALYVQALSRDQKRLTLARVDPSSGGVAELFTETSPTWVELGELTMLEKTPRFLWLHASNGHRHLELRDATSGGHVADVTAGDWDVKRVTGVDEEKNLVYFEGSFDGPLQTQLYAAPLAGGGPPRKITPERGTHDVVMDPKARAFADVHSAVDRMPKAIVRAIDASPIAELPIPADPDLEKLGLRPVELVSFKGPSGDTLYGAFLRPRVVEPGRRYPVLQMVYGGPGVRFVEDRWSPRLYWQHLADRGFVVVQFDNRGATGRGPAFEAPIYRRMGVPELEDQVAAANWLRQIPFADPARVALQGGSYGGFMAALGMLKAPGVWKVGIAGSPVTDFATYDSGYTERYMGTPADNPDGYRGTDLSKLAQNLQGKLFLIHALMDENVHFENTAKLVDALVEADKHFDLFVFPGERHGYRGKAARRWVNETMIDYLVKNL